jgi:hypothetical protein
MPVVSSQIPLLRKLYQYTTNGMVSIVAVTILDHFTEEEGKKVAWNESSIFLVGKYTQP